MRLHVAQIDPEFRPLRTLPDDPFGKAVAAAAVEGRATNASGRALISHLAGMPSGYTIPRPPEARKDWAPGSVTKLNWW